MREQYRARILLVDDENSNLEVMGKTLELEAYQAVPAKSGAAALGLLKRMSFDLVLTDLRMPGMTGLELLRAIRRDNPRLPVIILTAYGTVDDAVEAMKLGAVDFLSKPVRRESLLRVVQDTLSRHAAGRAGKPNTSLQSLFLGASKEINEIKRTIRLLAPTSASVFIEGESGSGKEVIAQCIHQESGRAGALISINCGAIPEGLLESELFGYERGAFTGAISAKRGLFEAADNGTLFLDEVSEMSLALQVKLLRVLQDGIFYRLGGTEPRKADVRIVAATNADVRKRLQDGNFREDLFYRLNVVSLKVPPLRERGKDILLLARHFLRLAEEQYSKPTLRLMADAESALLVHPWPGNVRELKNMIERTVVMMEKSEISALDLGIPASSSRAELQHFTGSGVAGLPVFHFTLGTPLHEIELEVIRKTLEYTGNDKIETARLLGINQRTVYRKLEEIEKA